jgi:hypothetical protein
MKVNNVILTKNNLKEMVKSWESELSTAIGYTSQVITDDKSNYPMNESIRRMQELKKRMNMFISGCDNLN